MTIEERDAIKVGDIVTFEFPTSPKPHTGTVTYAGLCGLDVRLKTSSGATEIYNVYRSEVIKVKKGVAA